jgi:hypothetical protein
VNESALAIINVKGFEERLLSQCINSGDSRLTQNAPIRAVSSDRRILVSLLLRVESVTLFLIGCPTKMGYLSINRIRRPTIMGYCNGTYLLRKLNSLSSNPLIQQGAFKCSITLSVGAVVMVMSR